MGKMSDKVTDMMVLLRIRRSKLLDIIRGRGRLVSLRLYAHL
jgi:hypothetical protein